MEKLLKGKKMRSKVHQRVYRNKPLRNEEEAFTKEKSKVRVRVEHVFEFMKTAGKADNLRAIDCSLPMYRCHITISSPAALKRNGKAVRCNDLLCPLFHLQDILLEALLSKTTQVHYHHENPEFLICIFV